ncbi:S24 family peptidase [Sphingobium sp. WTD-1]|uniref:XRE family transcriptional regulator n=1 Tax=Sphingobium sp. WTD-1 TaxID=2979467 RepID=UPI0024DE9530|nr:S24 family peptidase [Sphingobium sp. WTD-1]WIA56523.1 S24 family peptidase [Sphingobium sp. WTD-1]
MVDVLTKVAGRSNKKSCIADFYQGCNGQPVFRSDRLAALMADKSLSQSELARRVGISSTAIWKLMNEPAQGSKHTHKIARELDTTAEYLMGETDDAGMSRQLVAAVQPTVEIDPDLVEIDSIDLKYGMGGTFLDTDHIEVEKVKFSRSWISQFTKSPPHMLCSTKGVGDSMMPTIHDQDVVIIDRSQTRPEMGDKIWAIVYSGWGMIKRLRAQPDGTIRISSDNQLIRDDFATDGDLFIVGRVVAVVKSV